MRAARKVTIFCPVEADTFAALLRGELERLEADPLAAPILAVIRADNPLGDFGTYLGVFELALGIEGFTPGQGAAPVRGAPGGRVLSPTLAISTFVDAAANPAAVSAALEALAQAHPWEIPVIEVSGEVQLVGRRPDDL